MKTLKFFHGFINGNIKRSRINGISSNGCWETDPDVVKDGFFKFFAEKFYDHNLEKPKLRNGFFKKLSEENSVWLERPFSMAELKEAVWSCGNNKSAGPDGFTFKFLKVFWDVVCNEFLSLLKILSRMVTWIMGVIQRLFL